MGKQNLKLHDLQPKRRPGGALTMQDVKQRPKQLGKKVTSIGSGIADELSTGTMIDDFTP